MGDYWRSEIETLKHVMGLVEAFRAFDGDNDGRITEEELGGMMGSLGYKASKQEMKKMMEEGDKDRDGKMSIEEFLEVNTKEMECGEVGNMLKMAFEAMDEEGGNNNNNNNNVVTGEELYEVMGEYCGVDSLSLQNCESIVASLDVDGDGAVSLDDVRIILDSLG